MSWLVACARAAGRIECMGLLASPMAGSCPEITAACLLPAQASRSHAVAEPVVIKQAMVKLQAGRLRPRGLWHSHADHPVYSSATDNLTVARLLPAMAEWNFQRPRPAWLAPVVTGPDQAVLPLLDGQSLHFTLLGPEVPGLEANEQVAWSGITTSFSQQCRPRVLQEADLLRLEAGGVTLTLGIPEGASLRSQRQEIAAVRTAQMGSLVVNNRGESYAEVLVIHDLGGQALMHKEPCAVELIEDVGSAARPAPIVIFQDGTESSHFCEGSGQLIFSSPRTSTRNR